MLTPQKLLTVQLALALVLALAGTLVLSLDGGFPVHWDALGRPDATVPRAVALTHIPAVVACLWSLGRLGLMRPVWIRTLGGAATALTAAFAYGLAGAAELGPWALVGPVVAGAPMLHAFVADVWRARDAAFDDVRDG